MKLLQLTRGLAAMVDDEDWERVTRYKWNSIPNRNHTHYAVRGIYDPLTRKISRQWLHRFILDAPDGITVDHIDRNGLNCQRNNLRLATRSQQQINRNSWSISGFRGVSKHGNSWQAEVKIKGKRYTRREKTPEEAAMAYDMLAKQYHGEFAVLNFPDGDSNV